MIKESVWEATCGHQVQNQEDEGNVGAASSRGDKGREKGFEFAKIYLDSQISWQRSGLEHPTSFLGVRWELGENFQHTLGVG